MMRHTGLINKHIQLAAAVLLVAAFFVAPSYSLLGKGGLTVETIELAGASGAFNNVAFAFDRYVLVSPYMPEGEMKEEYDLSELTNHSLLLFDTKKPDAEPQRADLWPLCFPTKVLFDVETQTAFVRGTAVKADAETGEVTTYEAIAHLRVNLTEEKKPVLDSTVTIVPILGEDKDEFATYSPSDMVLGNSGRYLVFTNGSSIFTYNLTHGYIYGFNLVRHGQHSPDYEISHLSIEEKTNTIAVAVNKRDQSEDGSWKYASELHFYKLEEGGALTLLSRCLPDKFSDLSLPVGNNVAIAWSEGGEPGTYKVEGGYFIANDGTLCYIDLQRQSHDLSGEIKRVENFPALKSADLENSTPRIIQFDPQSRVLVIVKRGFERRISRPFNGNGRGGRPGKISRPFNSRVSQEPSAIILVKLNKKGKVTAQNVLASQFEDEAGVSNFILSEGSKGLVSTYGGNLFSVDLSDDLQAASVKPLGNIGSRVEHMAYTSYRSSVVALNSCDVEGESLAAQGALTVAKLDADAESTKSGSLLQMLLPASPLLVARGPMIRRPYNLRR